MGFPRRVVSSWKRHRGDERIAAGAIAALVGLGVARAAESGPVIGSTQRPLPTLHTRAARFAMHAAGTRLIVESEDGALVSEVDLSLEINGQSHPLELAMESPRLGRSAVVGVTRVPSAGRNIEVRAELVADVPRDALTLRATAPSEGGEGRAEIAIRATLPGKVPGIFVSGVGPLGSQGETSGSAALIDFEPHPIAAASIEGPVTVHRDSDEDPTDPGGVSITSPATSARRPQTELHFVVGESDARVWEPLMEIANVPTAVVRGHVVGASARRGQARIVGRDVLGIPQLSVLAADDGSFSLEAPVSVVQWAATLGGESARQVVRYVPGTPAPLVLDLAPRGGVRILVRDADTRQLITARLVIQRMEGEPSASAERPSLRDPSTVDALHGDATTTLTTGKYRVVATKGIEWSIDKRDLDVVSGQAALVELDLRHVVPTPGIVGCDLHTHTGPSFDSQSSPEDSVLSLVAAGIDFAVPTGHNAVTDDTPAVAALRLEKEFVSVPGVEVTTYNPRFGHFGVFPIPMEAAIPPYRHSNLESITRAARADPGRYFQLNHPRLPGGIGLFDAIGLDPHAVRARLPTRLDFDGIEVYNGFDIEHPARVEQVLHDYWGLLDQGWHYTATGSSDSHCLQYHCVVKVLDHTLESCAGAGYPRTMVTVDPHATASHDQRGEDLDPRIIIDNLKHGHATVTSGPMIDLRLEGVGPGDDLTTNSELVHGRVMVRAAPWIDVTQVQIVAGQYGGDWRTVDSFDIPTQPTQWGPGEGTLEEAQARTIRFDREIDVPLGPTDGWVVAIARGSRRLSDVLPLVEVTPLGFTNPVYVVRRPEPGSLARTPIR